jgi:hypothetical protein
MFLPSLDYVPQTCGYKIISLLILPIISSCKNPGSDVPPN